MNLITQFFYHLQGLRRTPGQQISQPTEYSSSSAAPVTFDTAMAQSAFWACVRLLSETLAAMPIKSYVVTDGARIEDKTYPLWRVLNYQPNRYQTRNEFFETLMLNLVTDGNAYNVIQRDNSDNIIGLLPLMSAQIRPFLLEDGEKVYEYTIGSEKTIYSDKSIWHVKLFGNGVIGLSPLAYARQSIGTAIATDSRVSTIASNGGKQTGILTIDKILTEEQRKQVKREYAGLTQSNNDRLFVLEAGFDFKPTSLSPTDMQMLESRRFQVEDIARFMGVPSVLINDTSGTTAWGSGIQQIVSGWYKLGLRPYLERIESSMKRNLMPVSDWDWREIEFDFDALLRADQETRFKTMKEGVNSGIITPNEARKSEGLPPKEGGDSIYLNGTMQVAGSAQGEEVENAIQTTE